MALPFGQFSFSTGEIAPALFGHVDLVKFKVAATTMRNLYVSYRGGAYSRPGTAFVGFSKQTGRAYPPRLVPFQFSITQGLTLEFGNQYMRIVSNGAFVTEAQKNVTGASNADPGLITSAGHGYSNGEWVYLGALGGIVPLNGNIYAVEGVTANTFQLYDAFGNPVDTTAFPVWTGGGFCARIYTLPTPYGEADLKYLKWTQDTDVMSICCVNQVTATEYAPMDLERLADDDWQLVAAAPSPTIGPPAWAQVSASGTGDVGYAYVVTAVAQADGTESIASPQAVTTGAIDIASTAGSLTITWGGVDGNGGYNIYKAAQVYSGAVAPGAQFGYAGTALGTSFTDSNIVPDFQQVPPTNQRPFARGQITDVRVTNQGSGISTATWLITSANGTGFNGYPVVVGGFLQGFVITDPGEAYEDGDSIAFDGAGYAAGAVAFATNPANNDTITLNGTVWTFKTAIGAGNQTQIQGSLAQTLTLLAANLSASAAPALTVANYTINGDDLLITYNSAGTAGNAYTLAASSATPSGATLTGGSGTTGDSPAATLIVGAETGTYPGVVSYYQQRRVYANSLNEPNTYDMSQPGSFLNFDTRNPTIDDDAITGSPWSVQVNGIQWLIPMPGGLVVLTGAQAWQLTGAGGSGLTPVAITPSDQQAQPQAYNGISATLPPIQINYDILFADAVGSQVYDLAYQYWLNIYTGTDLTIYSPHLFAGYSIREWAWCRQPNKLIWAVRSDGAMLSLTFLKEQEVQGWARSDTNGLAQSVCSVIEPPVNAPYFAMQRFLAAGAAYTIERMDNQIWAATEDCWCVDAGAALGHTYPAATISASSATGLGAITGVTGLVGGSGYSALTTASVVDDNGDGPGTGAAPNLTITDGVIEAITFAPGSQGQNYTYPAIYFVDPSGLGGGAAAQAVLDNSAIFTASAAVFSAGNVGQMLRMGGGIIAVTAYTDTQHVTGNILSPIVQTIPNSGYRVLTPSGQTVLASTVPVPQPSGAWTLDAPVTKIYGLSHLAGLSVTGLADGDVIPPTIVANDGSITLATPATQVIAGLGFQAQLQSPYLSEPDVQGQRKRIARVTARIDASRGIKIGSNQPDGSTLSPPQLAPNWNNLQEAPDLGRPPYNSNIVPLYTGDVRIPIDGGFEKPGQACAQQDNPLPMNILAFIPEVVEGDLPEGGDGAKPPPQQRPRGFPFGKAA